MKTEILDFFYSHTDELDWHDGLDLYTNGKVLKINLVHSLITAKVSGQTDRSFDVRLKIHPTGRLIQWIECTCRKNRSTGQYCEHIAAVMVSLQHDYPKLLQHLDAGMPMKAPLAQTRKKRGSTESGISTSDNNSKSSKAAHSLISHLKNIQTIRLLSQGPTIRIKAEAKPGEFKNFNLGIDDAAKFLASRPSLESASPDLRQLGVFESSISIGTRIFMEEYEDEKVVAEKVIFFEQNVFDSDLVNRYKATDVPGLQFPLSSFSCKTFSRDTPEGKEAEFYIFPLKSNSRLIGKEYFFIPGIGYWKLPIENLENEWLDLPNRRTFKEDAAARFVDSQYEPYKTSSELLLDNELDAPVYPLESEELEETKTHESNARIGDITIHEEKDGWFYLDPSYQSGDDSVSMIALMLQYREKKRQYLKTKKGWLKVPDFVKEHQWDTDETGRFLKVDGLGLMRIRAAIGDFDQFVGSRHLLNQLRKKVEFTEEGAIPLLKNTKLQLRPYQEKGLQWLWWLYQNSLHGLLADEMGLGKTHQAMALMSSIQTVKKDAKFLVLAPTTVLDHWEDKVLDFCPNLKPIKHHGAKRSQNLKALLREHHLIITSYGVLLRDIKALSEFQWSSLMLDEAHFVKNNSTATYRAVCRLQADIRLCLTGTPIENNLSELKNIFDFLVPGFLGSDDYFKKNFMSKIEQNPESAEDLRLQKLIHPFKLRRTKSQVLTELPEKVEDIRHCNLSEDQIKLYRKVLDMKGKALIEKLQNETGPVPYLHVFATLTMLKQICNHPSLLNDKPDYTKGESGKFELLKEILLEALGSEHKVVIYSQYVEMIKLISAYLTDENIDHAVLTGSTRNRGAVIKRFQTDPNCKVFIGSLLAGGIGIDLTAASVVIHYDRWWNASKENQATDRVYRIGQNKNVLVLKLVTRGTLEEKIDALIRSKQKLFEKFMDRDEELFKSFSRSDLINLLN